MARRARARAPGRLAGLGARLVAVAQRRPGAAGRPPRGRAGLPVLPRARRAASPTPTGTRGIGSVPSFEHDDVTAYAKSEGEIREWILDGKPRRLREAAGGEADARCCGCPPGAAGCPRREVDQLVAYVKAVSDFDPVPDAVADGPGRGRAPRLLRLPRPAGPLRHAEPRLPQGLHPVLERGRLPGARARRRARSASGSATAARSGSASNPVAAFFMRRQAIRMPAYGDRVSEDEVRQITAYIRWLRASPSRPGAEARPRAPGPWKPGGECATPVR